MRDFDINIEISYNIKRLIKGGDIVSRTYKLLLLVLLLAVPIVQAQDLRKGSSGQEVLLLQQALIEAGYLAREADGEFGSTTEKALRLFQRDHGWQVTGVADEKTHQKISQYQAGREGGGVLYAPGNLGEDVVTLQRLLVQSGYLQGTPDGVYGPQMTAAVQKFQRDHQIPVIGAIDEKTWSVLGRERGVVLSRAAVKGLREKKKKEKEMQAAQEKKAPKSHGKNGLRAGSKGKDVLALQRALIQHGYNPGILDAFFGTGTENALRAWQKDHGVPVTGIVDEVFWQKAGEAPKPPVRYKKKWRMESTAYTSQDGDTTNRTARGSILSRGHVAVDPDVIPLGSLVYVEGYGYGVADDIGGAIQKMRIDLAMETRSEALQWGRREVEVYLIELPNT